MAWLCGNRREARFMLNSSHSKQDIFQISYAPNIGTLTVLQVCLALSPRFASCEKFDRLLEATG
jgi:hypothetical protein